MSKLKSLIALHLSLLLFSASMIFSKYCSMQSFLSFRYILFFGMQVFCLGIFAVVWQMVLKKIPLSIAYANKGITIVWGMLIGYFLFHEKVSLMNIVGALIIIIGIVVIETGDQKHE
ncbi:MAG: transporter [Erysipelotrichaceae bacterium]|nr:transporter [Erysipelotrichaceae bacterium]